MEAELAEAPDLNLSGVGRTCSAFLEAVFVVDLKVEEEIAVREATPRLGIPTIGLVDTNCDPEPVDYVVPETTMRCARAGS